MAVFADHAEADAAVKQLSSAGFKLKLPSFVGKGYHTDETAVGFYNVGDRVKFWGSRGAFWGGMWGLFFGGLSLTVPIVGHVIVLGYLAAVVLSAVEGAVMVGGVSAIAAALASIGIPKHNPADFKRFLQPARPTWSAPSALRGVQAAEYCSMMRR